MAKEVEALTVLLAARTAEFERGMGAAERRIQKVERQMRGSTAVMDRDAARMAQRVNQSFGQVGKSFNLSGTLLAGVGVGALIKEAISYSDAFIRIGNSLRVAGVESGRQKAVQDALFVSAQKNSAGFESLAGVFGQASRNAKELGADEQKLLQFTDGVAVAIKASGKSASESSGALLQLGQLLGAGTVRAEEFNSVLEGAPTILTAVAAGMDGTGGSVAKLRAMVLAGEVSSKAFFDAFLKGKPVIDDMAAKALPTAANAVTRINNAMTKYVGENIGAQGATKALIGGLNYLADNFDKTADLALKFAGIIAAALVGRSIGGMISSLGSAAFALKGFFTILRSGQAVGGLASALGGLGAAAGPIGAALTVAGAAGFYFYQQSKLAAEGADRAAEAIKTVGLNASSSFSDVRKLADELAKLGKTEILAGVADTSNLVTQKANEVQVRNPFRGAQFTTPSAGLNDKLEELFNGKAVKDAEIAYNRLAKSLFSANGDSKTFGKGVDALAKQFPAQATNLRLAKEAAEAYSTAIKQRAAQDQALAIQDGRTVSAPVGGRRGGLGASQGEQARGASPTIAGLSVDKVATEAEKEAAKGERDKSIDKQTDELAKSFEKENGRVVTAIEKLALRDRAAGIVDAEDARKEAEKRYSDSASGDAFDLIKGFEGYSDKAYYDVNAFRAGYGSDTTTKSDGSIAKITKDSIVNLDDSVRDLKRRIGEFQGVAKGQVGSSTFDALGKEQQAALTSIAYNYGKLPSDIANAVKTGTTEDVAKAIRNRASDNGGINRDRRNDEADVYSGNATPQAKARDTAVDTAKKQATESSRSIEDANAEIAALASKTAATETYNAAAERSRLIREKTRELEDAEIERSPAQIARIEAEADAEVAAGQRKFDAEKKVQDVKKTSKAVTDAQDFFAENATSAFTDIITGASTAEQAMKKLASSILDAVIQATLLGKGPLAGLLGMGGSGGLFGSLFSGLGGAPVAAATGGKVSGPATATSDSIPAYLSDGEHVINAGQAKKHRRLLEAINSGRVGKFATGGEVGASGMPTGLSVPRVPQARSSSRGGGTVAVRTSIDLTGANGDETIRRISEDAAKKGFADGIKAYDRGFGNRIQYEQTHMR